MDANQKDNSKKAKLTSSAQVLLVKDVIAAADHYRDKMGFTYDRFYGEPPSFVILERDHMYIMLKQADDPKHVIPYWAVSDKMWNIYFWVDNADMLYQEFQKSGATIDYTIYNTPYGCREFGTQDLDGYDIGFGQIINKGIN